MSEKLFEEAQNWKHAKIGEILKIGSGKDYKHLKYGEIPVYGTGGYMLSVDDYLYNGESVCIGRKGTIDKPLFISGKFWTVDTLFYTYDFRVVTPRFCYYLFRLINWQKYNEASGVPSLSKETVEKIPISIPDISKQERICSILDIIDCKLLIEKKILSGYIEQKKYILRKMFI
jgi:type I restriction enzyme S subunit